MHDLIIVGAGPVGLAAAIEASRQHLDYLVVEKGCVVSAIFEYPTYMTFFTSSELLEIGGHPLVSSREKPDRKEALSYYRMVAQREQLRVQQYCEVTAIERSENHFTLRLQGRDCRLGQIQGRAVLVATGYYDHPNPLGIPGEDGPNVSHYYTEAHPFFDHNVTVVGAGNSAADAALDLYRHGANVTLVVRSEALRPSIKYWVKPDLENRIAEGGIAAHFRSEVREIRDGIVIVATPHGTVDLATDFTFALTGYLPDVALLQSAGVDLDDELKAKLDENFQSNVDGLYICGSAGFGRRTNQVFIENGREHALKAVRHLAHSRLG
jgi:thioredoxin reductase (NADPH)